MDVAYRFDRERSCDAAELRVHYARNRSEKDGIDIFGIQVPQKRYSRYKQYIKAKMAH